VGSYLRDGVFHFPLAERWNGTSWSVQKPPAPAHAEYADLTGLSCVSATACVAVGNYRTKAGLNSTVDTLAETWNGTSWAIQPTPNPAGDQVSGLSGVSCTSATACTAVGFAGDFGGPDSLLTLAESWNGTAWSIQPTPNPASPNHATLAGVSCTSPSACIAVGTADGFEPLAEAWNGTSWSLRKPPAPAGATGGALSGVSCVPGNACIAVGNYQKGSAHAVLAERWNGTAWSLQQAAVPAGAARSYLNGVSCQSAGACTSVGSYQSGKLTHKPLAETWNGTSWSMQRAPGPAAPRSGLSGVACPSASFCAAVGSQTSRYQVPDPLAEGWNGASWSIVQTAAPATFIRSNLSGIACPTAADCFGVGSSGISTGSGTLTEHWDGSAWSIQPTPANPGFSDYLGGIACTSATACTAVGGTFTDHGGHALAERWNGTSWSVQRTPAEPPHQNGFLFGVSCASAGSCVAVGYAEGQPIVPMAEVWNGSSWTIRNPVADGPGDSSLAAVSCTSASNCIAVGAGDNTPAGLLPLAERWDGTSWSVQQMPRPAGAVRTELTGVSCPSAGACLAVGDYQDSSSTGFPLAEAWNGTSWAIQPVSGPAGSRDAGLSALSCTSPSACTAVGGYSTPSSGATLLMAEVWNGTSWSVQRAVTPSGADSFFAGVACSAPGVCTAVGTTTTKTDNLGESASKTFAEAEP
jgi:hypothetical protein